MDGEMKTEDAAKIIDAYAVWMRARVRMDVAPGSRPVITTAFVDRAGDPICVYVKVTSGRYALTSDTQFLSDLESCDAALADPAWMAAFRNAIAALGVVISGGRLTTTASAENFAFRLHQMVQAVMLADAMTAAQAEAN